MDSLTDMKIKCKECLPYNEEIMPIAFTIYFPMMETLAPMRQEIPAALGCDTPKAGLRRVIQIGGTLFLTVGLMGGKRSSKSRTSNAHTYC
jgi:hypothetical protein